MWRPSEKQLSVYRQMLSYGPGTEIIERDGGYFIDAPNRLIPVDTRTAKAMIKHGMVARNWVNTDSDGYICTSGNYLSVKHRDLEAWFQDWSFEDSPFRVNNTNWLIYIDRIDKERRLDYTTCQMKTYTQIWVRIVYRYDVDHEIEAARTYVFSNRWETAIKQALDYIADDPDHLMRCVIMKAETMCRAVGIDELQIMNAKCKSLRAFDHHEQLWNLMDLYKEATNA